MKSSEKQLSQTECPNKLFTYKGRELFNEFKTLYTNALCGSNILRPNCNHAWTIVTGLV